MDPPHRGGSIQRLRTLSATAAARVAKTLYVLASSLNRRIEPTTACRANESLPDQLLVWVMPDQNGRSPLGRAQACRVKSDRVPSGGVASAV